jgi:branched-chain amino acid transport system permease protein
MEYFIQQVINGITLGSVYGLIAIGYTMVYGIIGMINFAHGDIFMIGAFMALITYLIITTFFVGVPVALALILMILVMNSLSMLSLSYFHL